MTSHFHVTRGRDCLLWRSQGQTRALGLSGQCSRQPVESQMVQHLELPLMGCPGHDTRGVPAGVWEESGAHISCSPMSPCQSILHQGQQLILKCATASDASEEDSSSARAAPVCSIVPTFM